METASFGSCAVFGSAFSAHSASRGRQLNEPLGSLLVAVKATAMSSSSGHQKLSMPSTPSQLRWLRATTRLILRDGGIGKFWRGLELAIYGDILLLLAAFRHAVDPSLPLRAAERVNHVQHAHRSGTEILTHFCVQKVLGVRAPLSDLGLLARLIYDRAGQWAPRAPDPQLRSALVHAYDLFIWDGWMEPCVVLAPRDTLGWQI